jgi:four helix bundle protein
MNLYKDLIVWQKARKIVKAVYELVALFPKNEQYCIVDQMKRAAVSIPSNIAEWNSRNSTKDQIQFLYIARGSCAELETQILLSEDLGFISHLQSEELSGKVVEISKMLAGLIHSKE